MATLGTIVVQDLTYTETQLGSAVTVSYTNGATAGHEVVSVSGKAITVQIQSGTSTATQVKAAFDASLAATALATCAISGTAGTAQVTCNLATLKSGTAAVKATLVVGPMLLTAAATGTSANSYTLVFTSGATAGSEAVSVSTNDITVQIADGVSTLKQVMDALNNDSTANTMVVASSVGGALSTPMFVAMAPSAASLAGGLVAAVSSHVVQDLTFAWNTSDSAGNGKTITYTTGATAGSEVVTVGASSLSVQIQNGTSTATQIKTKIDGTSAAVPAAATGTITYGTPDVLTAASKAVTYGAPSVGDTLVVDGHTFTCVTATPGANEFSAIAELTSLIDALTNVNATDNGTVITIVAATAGTAGNAITISKTGTALTFTGSVLAGGKAASTVTVAGTTFTCVTSGATGNQFSTITGLKNLVHALSAVNATENGTVVSVTAATTGSAGNSIAMTKTGAGLTLSGALLTGGVDGYVITVSGTGSTAQKTVNAAAVTGEADVLRGEQNYKNLSVTATGVLVRAASCRIRAYYIYNNSASATRYVRFYDKVTAPTVGTDVPVWTVAVPPMSAANLAWPKGSGPVFLAGLGVGASGAVADNDSTAVTANDVVMNLQVGDLL